MKIKLSHRIFSLLLITAMILSSAVFCFADESNTLHYVCFGNSFTCGYCFESYMHELFNNPDHRTRLGYRLLDEDIYPCLFRNYLSANLDEISRIMGKSFENVELDQLSYVGAFVSSYRYFLEYGTDGAMEIGPYEKTFYVDGVNYYGQTTLFTDIDEFVFNHPNSTSLQAIQNIHDDIYGSVVEADIISINLGQLEIGSNSYYLDLFDVDYDIDALLKEIGIPFTYDYMYNCVYSILKNTGVADLNDYEELCYLIKETIYDFLLFIVNYEYLIEDILDINPDVEIIVMSPVYTNQVMVTCFDNLELSYQAASKLAELFLSAFEMCFSDYNDQVVYADTNNPFVESFTDEAQKPSTEYSEDLIYTFKTVANRYFGVSDAELELIYNGTGTITFEGFYDIFRHCFNPLNSGYSSTSECLPISDCRAYILGEYSGPESDEKLLKSIRTYINVLYEGCYFHPNKVGHYQMFEILRDAFEADCTAEDVGIAYIKEFKDVLFDSVQDSLKNFSNDLSKQIRETSKLMSFSFVSNVYDFAVNVHDLMVKNINDCFDNILEYFGF